MKNQCLISVVAIANMFVPMLAFAEVQPGVYTGTLSCGELAGTPSLPGWSDKVQIQIRGSQLTWARTGIDASQGRSEYNETGSSQISYDGKAFMEAEGRYLPDAVRKGTWITRGELSIENGHLVGQNFTQIDAARTRILRHCTASIPVQTTTPELKNRIPQQATASQNQPNELTTQKRDAERKVAEAVASRTQSSPTERSVTSVQEQTYSPRAQRSQPAVVPTELSQSRAPKAGVAYLCTGRSNVIAMFNQDGRYSWMVFSGVLAADSMKNQSLMVGNWERAVREGGIRLSTAGIYDYVSAKWDLSNRRVNYYVGTLDAQRFEILVDSERAYECRESAENTAAVLQDLETAFEKLNNAHKNVAADRQRRSDKYSHIKSIDDVTALLSPMARAIGQMKTDPRCRISVIQQTAQLDHIVGQLAQIEAAQMPARLKPWASYGEIAENYAQSAIRAKEECTKQK